MLWMFESKEYAVILAASFLAGLLMDMILKKVTKQGETKYTAFLSICITAVFLGTYGTNEHALVCTLFGQMLLYASCVQQSWTTLAGVSPVTVIASEPCS